MSLIVDPMAANIVPCNERLNPYCMKPHGHDLYGRRYDILPVVAAPHVAVSAVLVPGMGPGINAFPHHAHVAHAGVPARRVEVGVPAHVGHRAIAGVAARQIPGADPRARFTGPGWHHM